MVQRAITRAKIETMPIRVLAYIRKIDENGIHFHKLSNKSRAISLRSGVLLEFGGTLREIGPLGQS